MSATSHRARAGPPMVLLHGIADTWRTWELLLPALERRHDVLAPTLPGHAGGPPLPHRVSADALLDELESVLDAAGMPDAHLVGNSLGGHLALRLAERGRARTVTALAPAGGWAAADLSFRETLEASAALRRAAVAAAPHAEAIAATPEGRRGATRMIVSDGAGLPPALVAALIRGAAGCTGLPALHAAALRDGWTLHPERIACPVRVVWGTADRLLPWPDAAVRYRREWLPYADGVEMDGVGHCPQLDVPLETAELILGVSAPGRGAPEVWQDAPRQ
jgi:pimeloyl-ACP methyl ester carboxylesterase